MRASWDVRERDGRAFAVTGVPWLCQDLGRAVVVMPDGRRCRVYGFAVKPWQNPIEALAESIPAGARLEFEGPIRWP